MAFSAALFTSLAVWGGPGPDSAPLLETGSVTDTTSLSVTESVSIADQLEISSAGDTASLTLSESGAVIGLNADLTDLMPWGHSGGYRDIGAKDLPAVADVDVTDTTSLSVTDTSATEQLAAVEATDTASITATEGGLAIQEYEGLTTELYPWGGPGTYREIGDKPVNESIELDVSDTANLSATEDPTDGQEITTAPDVAAISITESTALFNNIDATDTAGLSVNETVVLQTSGVLDITPTDSASISLTESVALDVELAVTDDASLSVTDSGTVDVDTETLSVTDTTSLSVSEAVVVDVFTGVIEAVGTDDAALQITESVLLVQTDATAPIEIGRIAFTLKQPSIRFRLR